MTINSITRSASTPTLYSIQYLRGLAALMVVFQHLCLPFPWLFNPFTHTTFGGAGIAMFFVISGFIMLTASRDEPAGEFLRRRLVRIVPLYWIATSIFAIKAYAYEPFLGFDWAQIIKSFFFIPYFRPEFSTDHITPLLQPGWTLDYEMFFYVVFAGCLMMARTLWISITVALLSLVFLGYLFHPRAAAFYTYTDPLLLEFLAGILIGKLYHAMSLRGWVFLLPLGMCTLLAFSLNPQPASWQQPGFTVGSVLTVIGCLAWEQRGHIPLLRPLKILGDSSYALYLSHTLIVFIFVGTTVVLPLTGWPQWLAINLSAMVLCVLFGFWVHVMVEKPAMRWFDKVTRLTFTRKSGIG